MLFGITKQMMCSYIGTQLHIAIANHFICVANNVVLIANMHCAYAYRWMVACSVTICPLTIAIATLDPMLFLVIMRVVF